MLFRGRFHPAIARGEITTTYRRWKSPRVRLGGRYRLGGENVLEVQAIERVDEGSIGDRAARDAGYDDRAALLRDLRWQAGEPGYNVYRITFSCEREEDARAALAGNADLTENDARAIFDRLRRLDASSKHGAWTQRTLTLIEAQPATLAATLASQMGRERLAFKADVRKLKALGLTLSLERGYRLSPRGIAVLRRMRSSGK
jgi:hypothetical protein